MSARKRLKRAAPEDLYRHCVQGGDCIPDVQNKFEQNTWADKLLKIFGSLLFFGNLGIGTGRGSGGSLGYRPLGTGSSARPAEVTPLRPNVTIDPIGPTDIVPIDASTPAIVPLSEGVPDIGYVAPDAGPGVGVEDIELFTITNPTTDVGGVDATPTVISTDEGAVAVIDAHPIPERPVQAFYDPSTTGTHELNVFAAPVETSSNVNVFVDPAFSGTVIGGFDEIPLQRLNYSTFDIEETPLTSTPTQKLESAVSRVKSLYNRLTKQVSVPSSEFISQPTRLVQFEVENPAFEADVTFEFERDLAEVTAAPAEEFQDVIRLHRPILSSYEGAVRVSRLGDTGTIRTRSGTIVGQRVHFFHDISDITPAETIELHSYTPEPTVVDDILESVLVDPINTADVAITENDLLDFEEENFSNTHLVVVTSNVDGEPSMIYIPTLTESISIKPFIPNIIHNSVIDADSSTISIVDVIPSTISTDMHAIAALYDDFFYEPSLFPMRKRRRLALF